MGRGAGEEREDGECDWRALQALGLPVAFSGDGYHAPESSGPRLGGGEKGAGEPSGSWLERSQSERSRSVELLFGLPRLTKFQFNKLCKKHRKYEKMVKAQEEGELGASEADEVEGGRADGAGDAEPGPEPEAEAGAWIWQQAWDPNLSKYFFFLEATGECRWDKPPCYVPAPWSWTRECHECPKVRKYWGQRYKLFSKYDLGIELDNVGWFSVTPEDIAREQAYELVPQNRFCVVIDAFAGVGGNAIQFAEAGAHVVAVELDHGRCCLTRRNAAVYGVSGTVHVLQGDFLELELGSLEPDVVFLSPPWGGPGYNKKKDSFDPRTDLGGLNGLALLEAARRAAPRAALFLPRNTDRNALLELVNDAGGELAKISEHEREGRKEPGRKNHYSPIKAITAYIQFHEGKGPSGTWPLGAA